MSKITKLPDGSGFFTALIPTSRERAMATDIVGSNLPPFASDALRESKRGYGQNGYGGASSDLPGENTNSGFLPVPDTSSAMDKVSARDGEYRGGRVGKGNPSSPGKVGDLTGAGKETRDVGTAALPLAQRPGPSPRNR